MANHFYNLKGIVPLAAPIRNPETGEVTLQNLSGVERVNLLNHDLLVCGSKPSDALHQFFLPRISDTELLNVKTDNGNGITLPLLNGIKYLVVMQSSKKTFYFVFTPSLLSDSPFLEVESEELRTTYKVEDNIINLVATPIDALLKLRKENSTIERQIATYRATYEDNNLYPRFIAHCVKFVRGDWMQGESIDG